MINFPPTPLAKINLGLQSLCQTKEQLISLLEEFAGRFSQVREVLQERCHLASRNVESMVAVIKPDIAMLDEVPMHGWDNDWYHDSDDEVNILQLRLRLENLLAQGSANDVVELGEELLAAGSRRVEMGPDSELVEEIAQCMKVVFQALPQSSLSTVEQMFWTIDKELADGYALCERSDVFWERTFTKGDWSSVADIFIKRIK